MLESFDIKKRLAELQGTGDNAGFYRPEQRVTVASTPSTTASSVLETDGCVHCHAAYGHKIKCPTWSGVQAVELERFDEFFLRSVGIEITSIHLPN